MKTIELTSSSFQQVLETSSLPVLVDFHAEWCGPCRMMGPVVDQIATEQQGKVTVAKLNIDDAPEIASRFGITSIPTLIVFKNGQPVASSRGAQSKTTIENLIQQAA